MSLGELLVIVIVALLVVRPEDIPAILKKLHGIKSYFSKSKDDFFAYLNKEIEISDDSLSTNLEEINFYLEKILNLEGKYEGKYELEEIKEKYNSLMKDQISNLPPPTNPK